MRLHGTERLATVATWVTCAAIAVGTSSCNLYSFIDRPSGDAQSLSKARACFDDGDIECAREYYQKISESDVDTRDSELAFAILTNYGANAAAFFESFGSGGGKGSLNILSSKMLPYAGVTARKDLFNAYKNSGNITDANLKGFVRFITGISLLAEVMAEIGGSDGFTNADFVSDPTTCQAITSIESCGTIGAQESVAASQDPTTTLGAAACGKPSSSALANGGDVIDLDLATSDQVGGELTLGLYQSIVSKVVEGLSGLGAGGDFSSGAGSSFGSVNDQSTLISSKPNCYRYMVLTQLLSSN